jgi:hypothetical protein
MTGHRTQKLVIGVLAAIMLVAGSGLAWAAGLTNSPHGSVPLVVVSDRPVAAAPSAAAHADTATVSADASGDKTKKKTSKHAATSGTRKTNASTTSHTSTKSKPKKTVTKKDEDEHETVVPPVRDEDEGDRHHESDRSDSSD